MVKLVRELAGLGILLVARRVAFVAMRVAGRPNQDTIMFYKGQEKDIADAWKNDKS